MEFSSAFNVEEDPICKHGFMSSVNDRALFVCVWHWHGRCAVL